jgi:hypothetical protein
MTDQFPQQNAPVPPDRMSESDEELRALALKRLKAKRDLQAHIIAYVTVNLLVVGVWWMTMPGGFFWPIFLILGWGIGLAFNIWEIVSPEPGPEQVSAEMERLRGRHA